MVVQKFPKTGQGEGRDIKESLKNKAFISRTVFSSRDRVWERNCHLTWLTTGISTFHKSGTQELLEVMHTGCGRQRTPDLCSPLLWHPHSHQISLQLPKITASILTCLLQAQDICWPWVLLLSWYHHALPLPEHLLPAQLTWETGSFSTSTVRGH